MVEPSAESIAQQAFDLGLLDERQLQEAWAAFGSRNVKLDEFVQLLVRREFLTNYQVERLLKGDRTGFFFGDYKVLYLVGSGTFARVYRAVHKETGQVVAVKVLRNRYSDDPTQFGQFVREGRVGCSLRHPNIVPIYDVISEGKTHFLVMEFVEGRNLREFVKIRKKIEPVEATRLMIDISEGLRYAFENGLTHRDLKMSNVLVSSRGQAKLVDFGLAAVDENLTDEVLADLPNTRTIDYAALERATGVRKDDTRSDIYFLGCIYYNMLTGRPPLERNSRPHPAVEQDAVPRSQADPQGRANHPRLGGPGGQQVDDARSEPPLPVARQDADRPGDRHEAAPRQGRQRRGAGLDRHSDGQRPPRIGRPGGGMSNHPKSERSVMVVESNLQMQDIFRDGFKRAGYRVLLTSDPDRALERFRHSPDIAGSVVFSAATWPLGPGNVQRIRREQGGPTHPGGAAARRKPARLESGSQNKRPPSRAPNADQHEATPGSVGATRGPGAGRLIAGERSHGGYVRSPSKPWTLSVIPAWRNPVVWTALDSACGNDARCCFRLR